MNDGTFTRVAGGVVALILVVSVTASADPIQPTENNFNVSWTNPSSSRPPFQIGMGTGWTFRWTNGSTPGPNPGQQIFSPAPSYAEFTAPSADIFHMFIPKDTDISDYVVRDKKGKIKGEPVAFTNAGVSPRAFVPLENVPVVEFQFPFIASLDDDDTTIYMGIDLIHYVDANVPGFASQTFTEGQTLNDLGITIVNGQIPGVPGLYFATSELGFDPNSTSGFVPLSGLASDWLNSAAYEAVNGPLGVIGFSGSGVPEPGMSVVIVLGTALATLSRRFGDRDRRRRWAVRTSSLYADTKTRPGQVEGLQR